MDKKIIRVCAGRHCTPRGSPGVMRRLQEYFGLQSGEQNDQADLDFCPCTGYCDYGPNVVVNRTHIIHGSNGDTIVEKLEREEMVKMMEPDVDKITTDDFLGDI